MKRIGIRLYRKTIWQIVISVVVCAGTPWANGPMLSAQEKGDAKQQQPQATSLLGQPLHPMALSDSRTKKLQADLNAAIEQSDQSQVDYLEQLVWVGRRHGYLQDYRKAIDAFSACISINPEWPDAYRHRGHRYISIRKFDLAIADFKKAAELIEGTEDRVEQDGAPNKAGIPTSTLHTNIWYHLGLAHYLQEDFESALAAYEKCLAASKNNDMKVATLDWMYMTLRRLNRNDQARKLLDQISADMKLLENHSYHKRLLMYKGELEPDDLIPEQGIDSYDLDMATFGYGVGNWYLVNGQREKAIATFEKVIEGKYWSAFGYVAAEAELARLRKQK